MRDLGSRAFSVWVRVPSGAPEERDSRRLSLSSGAPTFACGKSGPPAGGLIEIPQGEPGEVPPADTPLLRVAFGGSGGAPRGRGVRRKSLGVFSGPGGSPPSSPHSRSHSRRSGSRGPSPGALPGWVVPAGVAAGIVRDPDNAPGAALGTAASVFHRLSFSRRKAWPSRVSRAWWEPFGKAPPPKRLWNPSGPCAPSPGTRSHCRS